MLGPAFVGVSLDSTLFSREWVRQAIREILSRHTTLEFVLGDRLLAFNKTVHQNGGGQLVIDTGRAESRIAKRASDILRFLRSEISKLGENEQGRISIAHWGDYSDAMFVNIARTLTIAYSSIAQFQECVDRDVEVHLMNMLDHNGLSNMHRKLCALYVVEETAMIIRITESGRPHEYYPQNHIFTLTEMYKDTFADLGLTVESLVGHPKNRIFAALPLIAS